MEATSSEGRGRVPIDTQSIDAPLTSTAIFLVMKIGGDDKALAGAVKAIDSLGGSGQECRFP